jgi:hypothetical protein
MLFTKNNLNSIRIGGRYRLKKNWFIINSNFNNVLGRINQNMKYALLIYHNAKNSNLGKNRPFR